jgi:hypothetical protein
MCALNDTDAVQLDVAQVFYCGQCTRLRFAERLVVAKALSVEYQAAHFFNISGALYFDHIGSRL